MKPKMTMLLDADDVNTMKLALSAGWHFDRKTTKSVYADQRELIALLVMDGARLTDYYGNRVVVEI